MAVTEGHEAALRELNQRHEEATSRWQAERDAAGQAWRDEREELIGNPRRDLPRMARGLKASSPLRPSLKRSGTRPPRNALRSRASSPKSVRTPTVGEGSSTAPHARIEQLVRRPGARVQREQRKVEAVLQRLEEAQREESDHSDAAGEEGIREQLETVTRKKEELTAEVQTLRASSSAPVVLQTTSSRNQHRTIDLRNGSHAERTRTRAGRSVHAFREPARRRNGGPGQCAGEDPGADRPAGSVREKSGPSPSRRRCAPSGSAFTSSLIRALSSLETLCQSAPRLQ